MPTSFPGVRGYCNSSVVHMRDQRNGESKGSRFLQAQYDSRESQLGVKMCIFSREKKRSFWILVGDVQGSFFKPIYSTKRVISCLEVKLECKNRAKFQFRWCFSWKGQISIRVCFETLWSCVQHQYSSTPPPPRLSCADKGAIVNDVPNLVPLSCLQ